jgi:hypothetical protein
MRRCFVSKCGPPCILLAALALATGAALAQGALFHGHCPARAFIGADKLVRGAHFEVLGVAVKTPRKLP